MDRWRLHVGCHADRRTCSGIRQSLVRRGGPHRCIRATTERSVDTTHRTAGVSATKLEAFYGRGGGDFLASHDLEDLAVVIDGRPELVDEVAACEAALRAYLADEIGSLLRNAAFLEALSGHLPGDETSQARLPIIRERLRLLTKRGWIVNVPPDRQALPAGVVGRRVTPPPGWSSASISREHGRELQERSKSFLRNDSTEGH